MCPAGSQHWGGIGGIEVCEQSRGRRMLRGIMTFDDLRINIVMSCERRAV